MAIEIVEHSPEYQDRVRAFNSRLKQKGSSWAFYEDAVPEWNPKRGEQSVWRQYYLAIDEQNEVRGAYCLKRQTFWFNGGIQRIASFQGPVSEGIVDKKYGLVAVNMLRDMLSREPGLLAWGGGAQVTNLLRAAGWWIKYTPLCLKVCRPCRFLRQIRMLRTSASRKWIMDSLAFSGLGWIGLKTLAALQKIAHHATLGGQYEIEENRGDWCDDLWLRCRSSYNIVAVRNQETTNLLMPVNGWPPVVLLRVRFKNEVVGSAAVLCKSMQDDSRFGFLRVGTIVDVFGLLEHCARIVAAATHFLEQKDVDVIISNQTHPSWLQGFRANGFHLEQGRRMLALSKSLRQSWASTRSSFPVLHLTNLDGDGPLGLG